MSGKSEKSTMPGGTSWWWLVVILLIVLVVWTASAVAISLYIGPSDRGTFGDMFGPVSSLFSGFAFACLIFAIYLQKEELKLQREELKLQRKEAVATRLEIQGQKEQATELNKTSRRQQFDHAFFQMLGLHNDIVSALEIRSNVIIRGGGVLAERTGGDVEAHGRDCFRRYYNDLKRLWVDQKKPADSTSSKDPEMYKISSVYYRFMKAHERDIGHYVRNLEQILIFVDEMDDIYHQKYVGILQAQLSAYELPLIFYNCLSNIHARKLTSLIQKYNLIYWLDLDLLLDADMHMKYLDRVGFSSDIKEQKSTKEGI